MSAAAEKSAGKVTADQQAKLLACAQSAYAAEGLRKTALDAVAGTLQPADLPPLQAWYDSPLGRKIAVIERDSSQQVPDPQERIQRGTAALARRTPRARRRCSPSSRESHSVEMMTDTVIEMTLAVQQGMASVDPSATANSNAALRAQLASRRPQIVEHYAQISLDAYAFTYGELTDGELQQYADFLGSAGGASFNDGTMRGIARALNSGATQLGKCMQGIRPTKGS